MEKISLCGFLPLFVLIFTGAFIEYNFSFSIVKAMNEESKDSKVVSRTIVKVNGMDSIKIEYKLVEDDGINPPHKRYAAFMITQNNNNEEMSRPVTIKEWAQLFSANNDDLIENFTNHILQNTSEPNYKAFFFETKGASMTNASRKQFEFVLVQAKRLHEFSEREGPQPDIFKEYLDCIPSSMSCCAFDNLGRTARLIAPKTI